jgi:GTP-binding protein YchF
MKIGIVWLPNVGKSTLFNALTKSYSADAANFPFCTIDPNVGMVDVHDERLDALSTLSRSEKIVPATVNFVDIAWLVKGASAWEWLGNKFLAHIREVDAIVQVIRHFENSDVVHVEWRPDPDRDREIINDELMIADIQSLEKKLPERERKAKSQDKEAVTTAAVIRMALSYLTTWVLLYTIMDSLHDAERQCLKSFHLLTTKPFIYALNVAETSLGQAKTLAMSYQERWGSFVIPVCAKIEAEMMGLDDEERALFLADYQSHDGQDLPTLHDVIACAFSTLGLMYYFTTGDKETRAWTIKRWSTAPQAAGAIHWDFERWFIRAETVQRDKLLEAGGWAWAKAKGYIRSEGKEYVVQDGDVMLFRFNV